MSVQSEINRINNEVTGQADLIAQIQTALEGKAGGGGGSVETCTLTITTNAPAIKAGIVYYVGEDMELHSVEIPAIAASTQVTVVKNSIFYCSLSSNWGRNGSVTNLNSTNFGPLACFIFGDSSVRFDG